MEERKKKSSVHIVLGLLIAICVIQCAPNNKIIKQDAEAVLRGRAQEYWSYKIKGEWDKSYPYELPEFREKNNIVKYIQQNGRSLTKWEEFDILETWTSAEDGFVKVKLKYRYLIPITQKAAFERVSEEKWIKKDGQWYHVSRWM